jgi:carboxyl-terminal processing protease
LIAALRNLDAENREFFLENLLAGLGPEYLKSIEDATGGTTKKDGLYPTKKSFSSRAEDKRMIRRHFTIARLKTQDSRFSRRAFQALRFTSYVLCFASCAFLTSILGSFPILAEEHEQVSNPPLEEVIEQEDKAQIYEKEDVYRQLELFSTALSYVLLNYYKDLTKEELEKLMNGAVSGMLRGLDDRYSFYQSETRRRREQENLFYAKFGGLGIRILPSPDGFVNIVQPMDGTPAIKAGLRSGDKIIKVNGESIEHMAMSDVVDILRGEVGTDVTITIVRQGRDMPFPVTITRGIIDFPSVRSIMLEDQIGYVRISSFTAGTPEELKQPLEEMKGEGMRALILDLRSNTGGMMSSAVAVADAFLSDGIIVSTDGKLDRFDSEHKAKEDVLCPMDMPLAILVNGNSASGSEIVAGAMKAHKRGIIVGEKTFGKGVVQQRFPLDEDRAVSITVSIYKTPDGKWIHNEGIEPDVEVKHPNILEGEDDEMLTKLYEGEYIDKFVYDYLDKHPDQDTREQLQSLEAEIPELMKTLADDGIKLSDRIISWYVRRTFAATKYIPNIDLENDPQLVAAIKELKKLMG